MHNKVVFHKVCARQVTKQLTEVHKQTRVDICQKQLDRYGKERDIFLDRIITGDKTWVQHYEPQSKRQSMEWKQPQSPCKKKFNTQPSAGKQSPVLEHYQERGTTINRARYSEMLTDRLKPSIRSKRRGLLSKLLCCCTTMTVHILLPPLLRCSGNSNLKQWLILHIQ